MAVLWRYRFPLILVLNDEALLTSPIATHKVLRLAITGTAEAD